MTGSGDGTPARRGTRRTVMVLAAVAFTLALLLFLRTWILIPFRIPTASMEPALLGDGPGRTGDTIIVSRLAYLSADPARWDVVAFRPAPGDAGGGDPAREDDRIPLVKRVVGLPGETVEVADGWLLIDGRPIPRPPALAEVRYTSAGSFGRGPVVLGAGEYFVLGDNSSVSRDSRRFGPVPRSNIFGKADWIILPWSRWGRVR